MKQHIQRMKHRWIKTERCGLQRPDHQGDWTPILRITVSVARVLGAGAPRFGKEGRDIADICHRRVIDNIRTVIPGKRVPNRLAMDEEGEDDEGQRRPTKGDGLQCVHAFMVPQVYPRLQKTPVRPTRCLVCPPRLLGLAFSAWNATM